MINVSTSSRISCKTFTGTDGLPDLRFQFSANVRDVRIANFIGHDGLIAIKINICLISDLTLLFQFANRIDPEQDVSLAAVEIGCTIRQEDVIKIKGQLPICYFCPIAVAGANYPESIDIQ